MPNIARRLTILACIVLALVLLGMSGFWLFGADRLRANLAAWENSWRANGGELSHDDFRVTGFPLSFRAEIDHPIVGLPQSRSPWRWQGPPVRLRMSPFAPRARANFPGTHHLNLTVLGTPVALTVQAETAEARYRRGGGETLYALHGDAFDIRVNGQTPLRIEQIDAQVVQLRGAVDHLRPSARFAIELDDVALPQDMFPAAFRKPIDTARLRGEIMGPFRPDFNRAAATAWRDLGGTMEITTFELRWGALTVNAVGTMALDEDLQPLAALTATVTGFNETIDALRAAGAIQQKEAEAAKALLNLLAKPPRLLGGPPEIAVPVTIQNQRLSLGPVALLTLPRLNWPD
jgi:hypothetical protein